jgi:tRNA threonylcarbamoyladenosine biosynthesis protein TsaB
MLILALDTSTAVGSVALLADDEVLARASASVKGQHGELLIGTIACCLEEAGRTLSEVELLAVGIGPGSFTGVRVGVATVKGLAVSRGVPLIGVVSLAAMARGVGEGDGVVAPLVHAHRGEVYAALYSRGPEGPEPLLDPWSALPGVAAERIREAAVDRRVTLVGDGVRRYGPEIGAIVAGAVLSGPDLDAPSAVSVAFEGRRLFLARGPDDTAALEPLYVRPSDAKLPATPLVV